MKNITTVEQWLGEDNQIGIDIWNKKYKNGDEAFLQWLERVSGDDEELKKLILEKKVLLGGRILANRGISDFKATYGNCFVLASPEDNLESIFDRAKEMARTYSYGGGVGIDISNLRSNGSKVNNTAKTSSGAVSFMSLYDLVTGLISQDSRRGALMISMRANHPDILEFINVKKDLNKITKANISIKFDDYFFKCLDSGLKYVLEFDGEVIEEIDPNLILNEMSEANWEMGEPGALYWDRICNYSFMSDYDYFENINPCGELPLPSNGACLLSSINLANFTSFDDLENTCKILVRAMDKLVTEGADRNPLEKQKETMLKYRPLGIGIMGLADMLINMKVKYGSRTSLKCIEDIMSIILNTSVKESALLAKEYGSFDGCDINKILKSPIFDVINDDVEELVRKYGLRNAQILTIAPTGTISTMIGVSGGAEPIFAKSYTRKTESLHGEDKEYKIYTPIVKKIMGDLSIKEESELPDYIVTSNDINHIDRIKVQAYLQRYVDNAISSTINLPESTTADEIKGIYVNAWEHGLKGITVFRNNCARVGILTTNNKGTDTTDKISIKVKERCEVLNGQTTKVKTGCGNLYITVNDDGDEIVEVFTKNGKGGGCQSNSEGLSRVIALAMRSSVSVSELVKQLKGIRCHSCTKRTDISVLSCPDAIAKALVNHKIRLEKVSNNTLIATNNVVNNTLLATNKCSECGEVLQSSGGCTICPSCGNSKCG